MATIHVAAGGNIATALTSAVAGDTITLEAGATWEGLITLPDKGVLAQPITITTNSPGTNFPADGYRVGPQHAAFMPKLRGPQISASQTTPAIRWAAGAQNYRFKRVQFLSNMYGNGNMVEYGRNDTNQTTYAQLPDLAVFDQCYFHGDPIWGQKRGIELSGKSIEIKNCYFDYMFGVGQDAMCIGGVNGTGPVSIINNYLEGAAYSVIFGGDDPKIRYNATVSASPAPTVVGCRLSLTTELRVGDWIAFLTHSGAQRRHTTCRSINTGTGDITYDAIDTVPDAPGDCRWGVQLDGITIRRNYFTKQVAWRDPLLGTPTGFEAVGVTGGGTLAAANWDYQVAAVRTGGYQNSTNYSRATTGISITLLATGSVELKWDAVPTATKYRIWRTDEASNSVYFETTSLTFTDTGGAGTAGTISSGTKTTIKNMLELKNGLNLQCDSNVFEYHWRGSDIGQCIWIKANNQGGTHEWAQTKHGVIEKNLFRHVGGWVAFSATGGSSSPADFPSAVDDFLIKNNLVIDSQEPWTDGVSVWGINITGGPKNVTIDHNTVLHQKTGIITFTARATAPFSWADNLTIKNNLWKRNTYGMKGGQSPDSTEGASTFAVYTGGTGVFIRNGMAGVTSNPAYPSNNIYPSNSEFEAAFVNYDGAINGDYHLKTTAEGDIFRGQGTDALDLGCDVDEVYGAVFGVIEGAPEVVDPGPPDPGDLGGTLLIFSPVHYQPTSSATPALDVRNSSLVLAFDGSVTENAHFTAVMPRFYAGQGVEVRIVWTQETDTNVSHACLFEAAFDRFNEAGQSLDTSSEGISKTVVGTPTSTPGKLIYSVLNFASTEVDGILGGDMFRFRLTRLPGDILDTLVDKAHVLRVELRTLPV